MKYFDGQIVMIGDKVDLGGGMTGLVVCSFDDGNGSDDFSIEYWGILEAGILVQSQEAGLIHFNKNNIDLVLIERTQK